MTRIKIDLGNDLPGNTTCTNTVLVGVSVLLKPAKEKGGKDG